MRLFGKNLDSDVPIIAEIGVNHEGSVDAAIRLLHLAHEAGADAAKFQTFTPERYASASDPDRLQRVTGFDLGEQGFRTLANEAEKLDFPIFRPPFPKTWCRFSTPYSRSSRSPAATLTLNR